MGQHVIVAQATKPTKYVTMPCPCCGTGRRVINGRWLAFLRTTAGIDQRTLGKRLRVSGPYLSDIERNRRDVPENILQGYIALE
jgi:Helix-turn-helix domain